MTAIAQTERYIADWQVDRAYETDTAKVLEKAYRQDDLPVYAIENQFNRAEYLIGQAIQHLCWASETADPYGKSGMIDELIQKLDDDFRFDMAQVLKKIKEGS